VGSVVNEELFVLIPGAEVVSEDRQNPVFGFNFTAQYTAEVGKPDKTPELFRLGP